MIAIDMGIKYISTSVEPTRTVFYGKDLNRDWYFTRLKSLVVTGPFPGMDLAYFSDEIILLDFGWLYLQQTMTAN
ncbi:MAG: hypothetical protein WA364_23275 [Candidatus Nitrosopolaris sp.]